MAYFKHLKARADWHKTLKNGLILRFMCIGARQDPFNHSSELLDTRKIVLSVTDCIVLVLLM